MDFKRVHLQFLKRSLGVLNISTGVIMARAELRKYPIEKVNFIKHEGDVQKRL